MVRTYYTASITDFLQTPDDQILGELTRHHQFALEDLQRNAWITQIQFLKAELPRLVGGHIAFEYAIPRMGKRVDLVLLHEGIIFVLEFKVGTAHYDSSALEQALDYAVDLKNFHEHSHTKHLVPIVIATAAPHVEWELLSYPDQVYHPIKANKNNLVDIIIDVTDQISLSNQINPLQWLNSGYKPTPTIVQAAQALYRGHGVSEITRSDSGSINLSSTSAAIEEIIKHSKQHHKKSICFVTGVPGAGKTLAGLNIANQSHNVDQGEHAVFLSGNGPLVDVLQEALARNEVADKKGTDQAVTKAQSLAKTKVFIQNIHHFRDEALQSDTPPTEQIAVFDEAQRAWTEAKATAFMATKKGIANFNMSEPEFLISTLDRRHDWAAIVCLIGGGQEINTGEAGLTEWFNAIEKSFPHWKVYVSDTLTDHEYTNGSDIYSRLSEHQLEVKTELHLSVPVRSFRSERISEFVKSFLDHDVQRARQLVAEFKDSYPIVVTRNINTAKNWLKEKGRGGESIGLVASSGAYRLKPYGIHIKSSIEPKTWFLNDKTDVRSAGFLEEVATEFDIQGLELDWTCVAWDANLRLENNQWAFKRFRGTAWQTIQDSTNQRYLLNAYRVLLTRARQGMVIFIPHGDSTDPTRSPQFYDSTYRYFLDCGIDAI